jgi:hypothetical protein
MILIKLQVHLRYKSMVLKVDTPRGELERRPNMEPINVQCNIPLVRTLTTLRNLLVATLVPILGQEERRENIPRVVTMKNSRNPNPPPSMERLRRGKKKNFGYSF